MTKFVTQTDCRVKHLKITIGKDLLGRKKNHHEIVNFAPPRSSDLEI